MKNSSISRLRNVTKNKVTKHHWRLGRPVFLAFLGCFLPIFSSAQTGQAVAVSTYFGNFNSGNLASLSTVDGNCYRAYGALFSNTYYQTGISIDLNVSALNAANGGTVVLNAEGENLGDSLFLYLWNWQTNTFDYINAKGLGTTIAEIDFSLTSAQVTKYTSTSGIIRIEARASARPGYGSFLFIDQASYTSYPSVATSLVAIAPDENSVYLHWVNGASITSSVQVYRQTASSGYVPIATLPPGNVTFTDTGLLPSTVYSYKVAEVNAAGPIFSTAASTNTTSGNVNFSLNFQSLATSATSVASYWVGPPPVGISLLKRQVALEGVNRTKKSVVALPPIPPDGTTPPPVAIAATKYYIFRSTNESGPYIPISLTPVAPLDPGPGLITSTSATYLYSDQSLGTGASYYYYVIPVTSGVEGDYSETASDVPFGGEIPWDTENVNAIISAAKTMATGSAGFDPNGMIMVVGPDCLNYQPDAMTGTNAAFPPAVTKDINGISTTASGENFGLADLPADTTSGDPNNENDDLSSNNTGIFRRVTAKSQHRASSATIQLPSNSDFSFINEYYFYNFYYLFHVQDAVCFYMGIDDVDTSTGTTNYGHISEDIGVQKSWQSANDPVTYPGLSLVGLNHVAPTVKNPKGQTLNGITWAGINWTSVNQPGVRAPNLRYAVTGTLQMNFSLVQPPYWPLSLVPKNNGATVTTYIPVQNGYWCGPQPFSGQILLPMYGTQRPLTVITASAGIKIGNYINQNMKRISAIAQDRVSVGNFLTTLFLPNPPPVKGGYVPDSATVTNINWLNFTVDGTLVTPQYTQKAGYFPYGFDNFIFTSQSELPWYEEIIQQMSTGTVYHWNN